MKKTARVEILIIGNEILTGDVLDINTNRLCKMVHNRGGAVARVTVLPDTLDIIARDVMEAVGRKIDILFISGGLGPTSDDLTLQALAEGAGRKCVLHPAALEMVIQQYDHFFSKGWVSQRGMTPARKKMACLPQGAEPLFNAEGIAPGVFLRIEKTAVICLPGVPSEQQWIINQSLEEFLNEVFAGGEALSRCVRIKCGGESLVEPAVNRIVEKYPEIYTKTLASALGENPELDIILTISGVGEKETLLDKAFQELCDGVMEMGFSLQIIEE